MNKISQAFEGKKAFIAYLMAGDPDLDTSAEYILAAQEAGADLIEIGIPFSDPIAEGPVIQKASVRALGGGANLERVFEMVGSLKGKLRVPAVFMTYLNPVFVYGYERFFSRCRQIGISGLIIPDLPYEEQDEVKSAAKGYQIEIVSLVAPTSQERTELIAKSSEGFLYLVSSMGVTGMRDNISTDIEAMVGKIRGVSDIPVAVGFGISSPDQAARFGALADGVIVGSAIVSQIEKYGKSAREPIMEIIRAMKAALPAKKEN